MIFNFVLLGTALTSSTLPSQYSLKIAFKKFEYLIVRIKNESL
ncbi:hypothetical protein [Campylobacter sp.]|nr:hypothetical protein [Campylobacter sp.]